VVGPEPTTDSETTGSKNLGEAKASTINHSVSSSSLGEAVLSTNEAASVEELQAQLAQAKATIATYAQEGGLRMRNSTGSSKDDSRATIENIQQQTAAGVPIQVVAVLCLVSFLLAYLFF
jgi:hypothetical protein